MAQIQARTSSGADFQMYSSDPGSPHSSLVDSPISPTRVRLRPLNYLRTYRQHHTQNHGNNVHSTNQTRHLEGRSTSYISPPRATDPPRTSTNSVSHILMAEQTNTELNSAQSSPNENLGATSGWLPTVGGQSGVSRIATEPQATATASSVAVLSTNNSPVTSSDISTVMQRTNFSSGEELLSETTHGHTSDIQALSDDSVLNSAAQRTNPQGMAHQLPSIRFSAHQDPRAQRPSLVFSPMFRILPSGKEVIKVGRYSERDNQLNQPPNTPSSAPIGFKSKVVSRRHCEFWCYAGSWFIKDVKSSSGTFLNHIRLSAPGTESRPFPVHDGDIVQLGIDFKGGEEMIFRCVKIRIELNKGWQMGPSRFNMQSHKRLCELNNLGKVTTSRPSQDCSICLGPIAPCQPLFVAPCSHTWHYKCIRVIINGPHWPHFICPNCRNVADLEAEIEEMDAEICEEIHVERNVIEETNTNNPSINTTRSVDDFSRSNLIVEESQLPLTERLQVVTYGTSITDENLGETSDDSDAQVHDAAYRLDCTHIEEPSASTGILNPESSDSAVVSISTIPRQTSKDKSSELNTQFNPEISSSMSMRLNDAATGAEGPLTPRNNVGPYIFDGSGGDIQAANITPMNLVTTVSMPHNLPGPKNSS